MTSLKELQKALDEWWIDYNHLLGDASGDSECRRKLHRIVKQFAALRVGLEAREQTLRKLFDSAELLEELASLEHQQWSMLMAYIKSVSIEEKDIVEQLQSKWKEWRHLGNTPYVLGLLCRTMVFCPCFLISW